MNWAVYADALTPGAGLLTYTFRGAGAASKRPVGFFFCQIFRACSHERLKALALL